MVGDQFNAERRAKHDQEVGSSKAALKRSHSKRGRVSDQASNTAATARAHFWRGPDLMMDSGVEELFPPEREYTRMNLTAMSVSKTIR